MATGTLPDAGQILNSLINSILLVDDELAKVLDLIAHISK